ncbi:hypothetical protein ACOSP7_022333 [Xanthoceras sorbifolium]
MGLDLERQLKILLGHGSGLEHAVQTKFRVWSMPIRHQSDPLLSRVLNFPANNGFFAYPFLFLHRRGTSLLALKIYLSTWKTKAALLTSLIALSMSKRLLVCSCCYFFINYLFDSTD